MRRMRWIPAAGLALTVTMTTANLFGRNPKFEAACGGDATLLCPGRSGGALFACLGQNSQRVSSACKDYGEALWPCSQEAAALCADVPVGGGRLLRCLEGALGNLSVSCRAAVSSAGRSKGGS